MWAQRFKFVYTPARLLDATVQRIVGQASVLIKLVFLAVVQLNLSRGKPHFPKKINAKLIEIHYCYTENTTNAPTYIPVSQLLEGKSVTKTQTVQELY